MRRSAMKPGKPLAPFSVQKLAAMKAAGLHPSSTLTNRGTLGKSATEAAGRPRPKNIIRQLSPGENPPAGAPRRYRDGRGYIRLRWRVGTYQYVETYEHRLVKGVPPAVVHHQDEDKGNNDPANLQVLSRSDHGKHHAAIDAPKSKRVSEWEGHRSQESYDKAKRAQARRSERRQFVKEIASLYLSGLTTIEIGEKVGRDPANISVALKQAGVKVRPPARGEFDADAAAQMYRDGLGIHRVAGYFGVAATRVLAEVDGRGIPRHRVGRPTGSPASNETRARKVVYARSGGVCERCAQQKAAEWQHRKNRSQGGEWTAENGLHLCSPCHRHVTEHPAEGREYGWAVSRECDPATKRVLIQDGARWVWLTEDGTYSPTSPTAVA